MLALLLYAVKFELSYRGRDKGILELAGKLGKCSVGGLHESERVVVELGSVRGSGYRASQFEEIVSKEPDNLPAWMNIGLLSQELRDGEKAVRAYEEYLARGGVVIGVMPGVTSEEGNTILRPGDNVVLYTDGLTEAFDADRNQFSDERLIKCLLALLYHPLNSSDFLLKLPTFLGISLW